MVFLSYAVAIKATLLGLLLGAAAASLCAAPTDCRARGRR